MIENYRGRLHRVAVIRRQENCFSTTTWVLAEDIPWKRFGFRPAERIQTVRSAWFVHNALYKCYGQYVLLDNDSLRIFTQSVYFDPFKCWCRMSKSRQYSIKKYIKYLFWSTICFTFSKVHNIIFELFHESWLNKTV